LANSICGPSKERECKRKPGAKEQSEQREQQNEIRKMIHKIFVGRYAPSNLDRSDGYFSPAGSPLGHALNLRPRSLQFCNIRLNDPEFSILQKRKVREKGT
jgi:hypothetical protein